ncbi:hypothetical protein BD413DRAFT_602162 [Trametes elegans]|nr:hypothetical protein BD413DRAFT_602162 [Trametes elegans]
MDIQLGLAVSVVNVSAKTLETDDSAFPGVERSRDYWFNDGNIVLIVRDIAYKIHKSVLSRHSEVFRDLFSAPSTAADAYFDGCPALCLSESPEDVGNFLKALYDSTRDPTLFQHDKRLPFSTVAGLYELAHKYHVETLMEEMVLRLKTCFTNDLKDWDALEHATTGDSEGKRHTIIRSPSLEVSSVTDAIRAVNLVRLANVPTMLPTAVYLTNFHRADTLLGGIARAGGTARDVLSRADLAVCLDARVLFAHWTHTKLAWITAGRVASACRTPEGCTAALVRLSDKVRRQFAAPKRAHYALDPFANVVKDMSIEFGVCKKCGAALRTRAVDERRVMWASLPGDLGLEIEGWVPQP